MTDFEVLAKQRSDITETFNRELKKIVDACSLDAYQTSLIRMLEHYQGDNSMLIYMNMDETMMFDPFFDFILFTMLKGDLVCEGVWEKVWKWSEVDKIVSLIKAGDWNKLVDRVD